MNEIDQGKKFKYDICRILGHEPDETTYVCTRCEYNLICEKLKESLSNQYIGSKITSHLSSQLQVSADMILSDAMANGVIDSYVGLNVNYSPRSRQFEMTVNIRPTYSLEYIQTRITFNENQ